MIAKQVGDALAHGHPFDSALAVAYDFLSNLEFLRVVDHGFHPKNETALVVHLEPVLFNLMFDAASWDASAKVGEMRDDLSFKIAAQFTSKVHDLRGAKAQRAMAKQFRIEFRKLLAALEENIGREFTLIGHPVVLELLKNILHWRGDPFGVLTENLRPFLIGEPVGEFLRSGHIFDPGERIIELGVTDAIGLQFPGQPFMAVHINLDWHGKPGLNPHMDEPQMTVHKIEVQVQTLPPCGFNERALIRTRLGESKPEAAAGFKNRKNTHQAMLNAVALGHFSRRLILVDIRFQVLESPSIFFGHRDRMVFHALRVFQ